MMKNRARSAPRGERKGWLQAVHKMMRIDGRATQGCAGAKGRIATQNGGTA
jgi:hypothetical protein